MLFEGIKNTGPTDAIIRYDGNIVQCKFKQCTFRKNQGKIADTASTGNNQFVFEGCFIDTSDQTVNAESLEIDGIGNRVTNCTFVGNTQTNGRPATINSGSTNTIWERNRIITPWTVGFNNVLDNSGNTTNKIDDWAHDRLNDRRRFTLYQGVTTNTIGIGLTETGTGSSATDTAEGRYRRLGTGAVANNNAGQRINQAIGDRRSNPRFRSRFRVIAAAGDVRVFVGMSSTGSGPNSDDPMNAQSGLILCKRAADTNWFWAYNDGVGATVFSDTGVAYVTNTWITVEIIWNEANNRVEGQLNYGTKTTIGPGAGNTIVSSEIPGSSANVFYWCEIEAVNAVDVQIDTTRLEMVVDY